MAFDKPVTVTFTRQQAQILADVAVEKLGRVAMSVDRLPGQTKLALRRAVDELNKAILDSH